MTAAYCLFRFSHVPSHCSPPSYPLAGQQLEKQFEAGRDEFKDFESSKPEPKSREVPQWELLSKLVPPREQVDELKKEMQQAASKMRAKQANTWGKVVSIFNPSPGRYQKPTSSDLTAPQLKQAKKGKLAQPQDMHSLTYLLLSHLVRAGKLSNREFGKSVALYSSQGCEVQPWHIDFSDEPNPTPRSRKAKLSAEAEQRHKWKVRYQQLDGIRGMRKKPLGVFWALEEGCKIMLAGPHGEAVEVCLEVGDVLLFDGDLVHAGAAYPDSDNIRMHVYLYAEGIERPGKGTWLVPEFVPTREVQWHSKNRSRT